MHPSDYLLQLQFYKCDAPQPIWTRGTVTVSFFAVAHILLQQDFKTNFKTYGVHIFVQI